MARDKYKEADNYLHRGNNSYYAVNNAIMAARHERAFGNSLQTLRHLGKAAMYTLRSLKADRHNLLPSLKTIVGRFPDIVTQKQAVSSLTRKKPRSFDRGQIVNI